MASHKNHQQKEFKHLREVVKWLHNNKCYICNKPHEHIEVHHINKNSQDHRLQNLIPVCKPHHYFLGKMTTLELLSRKQIVALLEKKRKFYDNAVF